MSYRSSLDWLNFLLADLRGGLGPYVNVFLLTEVSWEQATIGTLLTASGLMGIAAPVIRPGPSTSNRRGFEVPTTGPGFRNH